MACFSLILLVVGAIFLLNTLFRWSEQTADAVDAGDWHKLILLTCMPFAVWLFPGKVKAGRPVLPPRHEPVRGFGSVKNVKPAIDQSAEKISTPPSTPAPAFPLPPIRVATALLNPAQNDGPPPGTPAEFIGLPKIPPAKKKAQPVDPEKMAMLKKKMREQGLLPPE